MKIFPAKPDSVLSLILASRLARITAGLAVVVLLVIVLLPYGIQYGIHQWLVSQGGEHTKIDDIDFNPFTGKLLVRHLQSGTGSTPGISIPEASLILSWQSLFNNRVVIDHILIKDAFLNIQKQPDGRFRFGVVTTQPPAKDSKDDSPGFGAGHITILNSEIQYLSSELTIKTSIKQATTGQLASWKPEQPVPLELSAMVNSGQLQFSGKMSPFSANPSLTGNIRLASLPLATINPLFRPKDLSISGTINTDSLINLSLNNENHTPYLEHVFDGTVNLHDLRLSDAAGKLHLWHSKAIEARDVLVKGQLSQLERVSIQTLSLHNATANLQRNAEGNWLVLQNMLEGHTVEQNAKAAKVSFNIDQIHIDGQTIINIHDRTVEPAFKSTLEIDKARISSIDNRHPDNQADLKISGKLDEYSSFTATARLQPFARSTNMAFEAKVSSLELPPFNSYVRQQLGYILQSGHLNADIQVRIVDDVIDGNSNLTFNNLKISAVDKDKIRSLTNQLTMPLDTALALLRDKNNNINLEVPVAGNINDPEFDLSDAINQALGKATNTAAIGYLKYSLGAFGTVITIGQLAGKAVNRISLEPVGFKAGSSELDDTSRDYLQHVAELLAKRPELRIRICGTAVNKDRTTMLESGADEISDEALRLLANTRATVIKDHLIREYAVQSERLFICHPETIFDKEALPRAKLML